QGRMRPLGRKAREMASMTIWRAVESSQTRVYGNYCDSRKRLLEYADVLRRQREIIYQERNDIIYQDDVRDQLMGMIEASVERTVNYYILDRKSTRLNSSHVSSSYAVFCS